MGSAIKEVLSGREGSYLMPFFWQHGTDEHTLRSMMGRIWDVNIREICVESRPHPDFCGPKWWQDMGVILDEAEKRGMRVWVLDDAHFPSGFAGGLIEKKYPQHRRRLLNYFAIDAQGPNEHASFLPQSLVNTIPTGRLEAVVAARRISTDPDWNQARCEVDQLVDLTDQVRDGRLYWPVPEGLHTVFVIYSYLDARLNLLNPISHEAVACQIEGCYEPHYQHYAHLFGKTFAGFFSDEPQFATGSGWHSLPGKDMMYPWSDELRQAMAERLGENWRASLPCLWLDGDERVNPTRYAYMDEASRLFGECFCKTLGDWCHAHGVQYIGHQVEDNNSHSQLGSGAGHFFRAQCAQDMAGVDIVMHQIHPGYDQTSRHWHSMHSLTDGEFFHYGLIKLASSMAHIDPMKQGRALCENFGAYGWMEGVRLMKWLADHCLVRGVNYFTPHAFTDSDFPEWDSPPHFYAQGNNPQYRYMGRLFRYMNRMCHLFTGGRHVADALMLYQADGEWWGDGMLNQKPMKALMQRQIDFDVAPCDVFDRVFCKDGLIHLNQESYQCLIIPGAGALPAYFLDAVRRLKEDGARILFVDRKPVSDTCGQPVSQLPGEVIALNDLAGFLINQGLTELRVEPFCPRLRKYHYVNGSEHYFMFFNEEPRNAQHFTAKLPAEGPYSLVDVMNGRVYRLESVSGSIELTLEAGEAVLVTAGCAVSGEALPRPVGDWKGIHADWRVSLAKAQAPDDFTLYQEQMALCDINGPEELPDFTGTIRYETEFQAAHAGKVQIRLKSVYETAEVWLNGEYAGCCLSAPYRFEGMVREGINRVRVEVTNTLAKQVADYSSAIVPQEPGGLIDDPEYAYLEGQET